MSDGPLFSVRNISLAFGGLKAVSSFCLSLVHGELHGLIGPNGAGKTTVFNLITGVYRPDEGRIMVGDRPLQGLRPWQIARAGIARTFQNIRLFPDLSVADNVRVGCHLRAAHTLTQTLLRTRRYFQDERRITDRSHELIEAMGLGGREDELARNLPYGDQRRLEIARALATGPSLLLLDEPAAGMNTGEKTALAGLIRQLRDRFGLTILLIEHDMSLVMGICERITVLDYGKTIAVGAPGDIQNNPMVIEAYLGEPQAMGG